jgi:hypothetical protein
MRLVLLWKVDWDSNERKKKKNIGRNGSFNTADGELRRPAY